MNQIVLAFEQPVHGVGQIAVSGEKLFSGCFPDPFRSGFDSVTLQNVGNRVACQFMAKIRQRALNLRIAPVTVLSRYMDVQRFDLLRRGWLTGSPTRAAIV